MSNTSNRISQDDSSYKILDSFEIILKKLKMPKITNEISPYDSPDGILNSFEMILEGVEEYLKYLNKMKFSILIKDIHLIFLSPSNVFSCLPKGGEGYLNVIEKYS